MLPTELWAAVIGNLDGTSDRTTLISLIRVSSTFYELCMPLLFEKVILDERGLHKLLAGGFHLSSEDGESYNDFISDDDFVTSSGSWKERFGHLPRPGRDSRWRKSLQLIRYMTLEAPLYRKSVRILRSVALPEEALFPGVQKLRLRSARHWRPVTVNPQDPTRGPSRLRVESGYTLFECPDLCVKAGGMRLLPALPSRGFRHVCYHTHLTTIGGADPVPTPWKTFRVFDLEPIFVLMKMWPGDHLLRPRVARIHAGGNGVTIEALYTLSLPEVFPAHLKEKHTEEIQGLQAAWALVASQYEGVLDVRFGDINQTPPSFPPCTVCGKYPTSLALTPSRPPMADTRGPEEQSPKAGGACGGRQRRRPT